MYTQDLKYIIYIKYNGNLSRLRSPLRSRLGLRSGSLKFNEFYMLFYRTVFKPKIFGKILNYMERTGGKTKVYTFKYLVMPSFKLSHFAKAVLQGCANHVNLHRKLAKLANNRTNRHIYVLLSVDTNISADSSNLGMTIYGRKPRLFYKTWLCHKHHNRSRMGIFTMLKLAKSMKGQSHRKTQACFNVARPIVNTTVSPVTAGHYNNWSFTATANDATVDLPSCGKNHVGNVSLNDSVIQNRCRNVSNNFTWHYDTVVSTGRLGYANLSPVYSHAKHYTSDLVANFAHVNNVANCIGNNVPGPSMDSVPSYHPCDVMPRPLLAHARCSNGDLEASLAQHSHKYSSC